MKNEADGKDEQVGRNQASSVHLRNPLRSRPLSPAHAHPCPPAPALAGTGGRGC